LKKEKVEERGRNDPNIVCTYELKKVKKLKKKKRRKGAKNL
jgi:hypothetical protein